LLRGSQLDADLGFVPDEEMPVPGVTHDALAVDGSLTLSAVKVALSLPQEIVQLAIVLDGQIDPDDPSDLESAVAAFAAQASGYLKPYAVVSATSSIAGTFTAVPPADLPWWLHFNAQVANAVEGQELMVQLAAAVPWP